VSAGSRGLVVAAVIKRSFDKAEFSYGALINERISDDKLRLITYAVLIYESYYRPPSVRTLERFCFWKEERTTGVMQVASSKTLTDKESVELGIKKLSTYWQRYYDEDLHSRTWSIVSDYNKDSNYVSRVLEISCLIPGFNGAIFSLEWKDALWSRFFTGAPQRQRRSVERYKIVKRA
jgi:hypothetical protein